MIKHFCILGLSLLPVVLTVQEAPAQEESKEQVLAGLVKTYNATKTAVAGGQKTKSDLASAFDAMESHMKTARVQSAEAMVILYQKAEELHAEKDHEGCIAKLKYFQRHSFKVARNYEDFIVAEKKKNADLKKGTDAYKTYLKKMENYASIFTAIRDAAQNTDFLIAKSYYQIMLKHVAAGNKEDAEDAGSEAIDAFGEFTWQQSDIRASDIAAKAYIPLVQTYDQLVKLNKNEWSEGLNDTLKMITSTKRLRADALYPIHMIDIDPDSIQIVFDVYKFLAKREGGKKIVTAAKKYLKTLTKLNIDWNKDSIGAKWGTDEKQHANWEMPYQKALLLADYCVFGMKYGSSSDKAYFKKQGLPHIKIVPTDTKKLLNSKYAQRANELRPKFGLNVKLAKRNIVMLINEASNTYFAKQEFAAGRQFLKTLIPATGANSQERARIWFFIGISYYQQKKYLEASFAFEKSQEIFPNWGTPQDKKNDSFYGERAFRIMMSAADRYYRSTERKDAISQIADKEEQKAAQEADREFIQMVRQYFIENHPKDDAKVLEKLPSIRYIYSADSFFSLKAQKAPAKAYEVPYKNLGSIQSDSKHYLTALLFRFYCSYESFAATEEDDTEQRQKYFERASEDAKLFFEISEDSTDENILANVASAQTIIIQLYLGQDDVKYLQENVELLNNLEEKYGQHLDERIKRKIPEWQLKNYTKIGDAKSIAAACVVWDTYQDGIIKKFKADKKAMQFQFDRLVRNTQTFFNDGFQKDYQKTDPKASDDDLVTIKEYQKKIGKWIKDNVEITPELLYRMIYSTKDPKQIAKTCEEYLEMWYKVDKKIKDSEGNFLKIGWGQDGLTKDGKQLTYTSSTGKRVKVKPHEMHARAAGNKLGMFGTVFNKLIQAYKDIGDSKSYKKAAKEVIRFNDNYNRRTKWLWDEAHFTYLAAKATSSKKKEAKFELYGLAASKYLRLRNGYYSKQPIDLRDTIEKSVNRMKEHKEKSAEEKEKVIEQMIKERKQFGDKWWITYDKTIDCRLGQKNYDIIIKIMKTLLTKLSDETIIFSEEKQLEQRDWYTERLNDVISAMKKDVENKLMTQEIFDAKKSHLDFLIRKCAQDGASNEARQKKIEKKINQSMKKEENKAPSKAPEKNAEAPEKGATNNKGSN